MAQKFNITVDQGTTYTMRLEFTDSDDVPIDVSTHTFRGQIRETYDASVILASFIFTNISLGVIEANIYPAVTTLLPTVPSVDNKRLKYKATYDIEQEVSPTNITRIVEGDCDISPEATR